MPELFAVKVPHDLPPDVFERMLNLLDGEAQTRIRKFRLQADKIRSLFGRLSILWYLLSWNLVASTSDAIFGIGEKGKPFIDLPGLNPPIEFNVSHDGDYVLLGVSRTGPIGVDIMSIPTSPSELEEALYDQMTPKEWKGMTLHLPPQEKAERLSTLWCIKEAYVKTTGDGLGFELERIDVVLKVDGDVEKVKVDEKDIDEKDIDELGFRLTTGRVGEGDGYRYACIWQAVGQEEEGGKVDLTVVSCEEIMNAFGC